MSYLGRLAALLYGLFAYLTFLLTFAYLIGFIANQYAFNTIDSGLQIPVSEAWPHNLLLLSLFGAQHSIMARSWFKKLLGLLAPAAVMRSTYVLATNLMLVVLFARWEPMPELIWDLRHGPVARGVEMLSYAGWLLVLAASLSLNHLDTFGLKQAWMCARGNSYQSPPMKTPWLYRKVRHPMMLGLIVAFWATPQMSQGHLLLAAVFTAYIMAGLRWEEAALIRAHPEYETYRKRVPMLIPRPW